MDADRCGRSRSQAVWFSPYLLAIGLSFALFQTNTPLSCQPTAPLTLSALELEVAGTNEITFDAAQRSYEVWLPVSTSSAVLRATSTSPLSRVRYRLSNPSGGYIAGSLMGVGGGEVPLNLPLGRSDLRVSVQGPGGAASSYTVAIQVGCSDCDDGNACTTDSCDPSVEICTHPAVADGTMCDFSGLAGGCSTGVCRQSFPCTEQGILDAIAVGGGPFVFACNGPTAVVTQAEIVIDNDVILDGAGLLTIQGIVPVGGEPHRLFSVPAGVSAELHGMTLTGGGLLNRSGDAGKRGAAIQNEGDLVVNESVISGNTVAGVPAGGGGINNTGTLTVTHSLLTDNHGRGGAGGIRNEGGTVFVIKSEISGNSADGPGGGIGSYNGALTLIDSTVSNNHGDGTTGISSSGETTLINSTVSGNEGVSTTQIRASGPLTIVSSTISGRLVGVLFDGETSITNSVIVAAPGYACGSSTSSVNSGGGNIETEGDSCGFTDPTDLVNVTPEELSLGPLADNGGPTETHALLPGSVAIDHVPASMCLDENGNALTADQRGVARPQGATCDTGAFEAEDCTGSVCDDGNQCTADRCNPPDYAWCVNNPVPDGTACDIGGVDGVCDAGACRERRWGTPVLIATGDDTLFLNDLRVVADPGGNVTAVWGQNDGFWSSRYTPTAGWGTALLVQPSPTPVLVQGLAVDPNGNATALWTTFDSYTGADDLWASRYGPSEGWSSPELLDASNDVALEELPSASVAMDPNGNVVVIWDHSINDAQAGCCGERLHNIWSNRHTPSAGWGTAELIETNVAKYNNYCGHGVRVEVAVDSDGNATAVWNHPDGVMNQFNCSMLLWANRYTPSGGWGTAEVVSFDTGVPPGSIDLAVDVQGTVTAVWDAHITSSPVTIWSNRYTPSAGWGVPQRIENNDPHPQRGGYDPKVVVDLSGNATAVWGQSGPTVADGTPHGPWSNRYTQGADWGTPVALTESAFDLRVKASAAVDSAGSVTAVWSQYGIWSSRYTPSAGWGAPALIENDTDANPDGARVAADPAGNVTAVWRRSADGVVYNIWSNRFE